TAPALATDNPFRGPEPFREGDPIFGRKRETAELISRLIADRLVLLYSPSGAGKSSLINAGVLRTMQKRGFRTHPTIRVGVERVCEGNRCVASCAASLEREYTPGQRLTAILGDPATDLFVFDQFEEILTADPTDDAGRTEFFQQLGEAMRVSGRWAIFAIREDYLAPMSHHLACAPPQRASRMRINILRNKEAGEAIAGPIAERHTEFEQGALEALLADLSPDGWVEPVQLQVVCKDLWDEFRRQ